MSAQNRQMIVVSRPTGEVGRDNFSLAAKPMPKPGDGDVLLKTLYVSIDPAMRLWMKGMFSLPVQIGGVMGGFGIGQVVESKDPSLKPGDVVTALTGVQDFVVVKAATASKIDLSIASAPRYLSALGPSAGITAYFGLIAVGEAKPGQTVVVSGAAGAVGSIAGQIARILGCRVIGIAGGPAKTKYLVEELGFDGAVDYRAGNVAADLERLCPDGVHVYFDNVGGELLDELLNRMAKHGRVVVCGAISQYNSSEPYGPRNYYEAAIGKRVRIEGFSVFDYAPRFKEAVTTLAGWLQIGALKSQEHIVEGIEAFPDALLMPFRGENTGKLMLKLADLA